MDNLLSQIINCSFAHECIKKPQSNFLCSKIINLQDVNSIKAFQVPEPWSGQLDKAPILFVSSNPSISKDDLYPDYGWSENEIMDFFKNRFAGGRKKWIKGGTKALGRNGNYLRATRFWASVRQRAIELLGTPIHPGLDYALTEIVHCKSRSEIGVSQAIEHCAELYLEKILTFSVAKVIIFLGNHAQSTFKSKFDPYSKLKEAKLAGPLHIFGRERMIVFLPHPNARMKRTFKTCYSNQELKRIRRYLK